MAAKVKSVRVTTLTIDPANIDWLAFNKKFHLYRYPVRKKGFNEKNYYANIHNWYKTVCDDPCYFNTGDEHVYVLYPTSANVGVFRYENDEIKPQCVDVTDPMMLHALVKTLVSNYFHTYQTFVSNADFFLPVANLDRDFITVLKIRVNQNWNNPNEFFFKDEAKFLRKLDNPQPNDFRMNTNYYGISYDENGNSIFKQLKYNSIGLRQRRTGVYIAYSSRKNRPQVTYHSVKSLKHLQKSRSYVLNKFFTGMLEYFREVGLPFQHKQLNMWEIDTPKIATMKNPQISLGVKTIYIVDDRMRPIVKPDLGSDNFAEEFCISIKKLLGQMKRKVKEELFEGKVPDIKVGDASKLSDGSYVLRIQDNEKRDFEPTYKVDLNTKIKEIDELALFNGFDDPLPKFYETHSNLVVQTLNINDNTKLRYEEKKRKRKSSHTGWNLDNYLDYGQPDINDKGFKNSLEVSLNQLILKDIVMHPKKAAALLPQEQLEIITNKLFIYLESLMYFDGTVLTLIPVSGNFEQAQKIIKDVTGKDLISDVIKPAMEYKKYQFSEDDLEDENERTQILKNGKFIVTKDYIWQIVDSSERMLYPDDEIEARLENLAKKRPISDFYPQFPVIGIEPFNEQQLRDYRKFLDGVVEERYISYDELKSKYAYIKIRDDNGNLVRTGEGLYPVLDIKRDSNFKEYLKNFLGLPIESTRSQDVTSVYQGIWYDPQTRQYLVGHTDSRNVDQEKGFVLREILVHQGNTDEDELFDTLKSNFFPTLKVNFVRHKQYTVYPFPFNLIEIWKKTCIRN